MTKATFQIDKSLSVPPGKKVVTDYVHIDKVKMACKDKMAIGDVNEKYQLVLQNAPNCIFPAPVGHWDNDRFVVVDGRHTFMAYVLLGYEYILVSWME